MRDNIVSNSFTGFCISYDLFRATRNVHPIYAHILLYGYLQLSSELNIMGPLHKDPIVTLLYYRKLVLPDNC